MSLAERWEMRSPNSNPCRSVERFRENKRERFLSSEELARLGFVVRDRNKRQYWRRVDPN